MKFAPEQLTEAFLHSIFLHTFLFSMQLRALAPLNRRNEKERTTLSNIRCFRRQYKVFKGHRSVLGKLHVQFMPNLSEIK